MGFSIIQPCVIAEDSTVNEIIENFWLYNLNDG